jgi:hypothetical protein
MSRNMKDTIKDADENQPGSEEGRGTLRPPDTPEYLAQKILEGIENDVAEIFAHDWMKRMKQS